MLVIMPTFSERHGFAPDEAEITVRNDAPYELRGVVVDVAYEAGLDPHSVRSLICKLLRVREDPSNWSAFPNVDGEARGHLDSCKWYEVYDVIEAVYRELLHSQSSGYKNRNPSQFEREINAYFRRRGVGWQLSDGCLQVRGPDTFEEAVSDAHTALEQDNRPTASKELHEALRDLSVRPTPDITGAIQHSMAALECVARDITGEPKATLGAILSRHPNLVPSPLDQALEKLWGFASEQGRHLREGRTPGFAEAQLVVHISATVARYLVIERSKDST